MLSSDIMTAIFTELAEEPGPPVNSAHLTTVILVLDLLISLFRISFWSDDPDLSGFCLYFIEKISLM